MFDIIAITIGAIVSWIAIGVVCLFLWYKAGGDPHSAPDFLCKTLQNDAVAAIWFWPITLVKVLGQAIDSSMGSTRRLAKKVYEKATGNTWEYL